MCGTMSVRGGCVTLTVHPPPEAVMFRSPTKLRSPVYLAARLVGVALFAAICLLALRFFGDAASTAEQGPVEDAPAVVLH